MKYKIINGHVPYSDEIYDEMDKMVKDSSHYIGSDQYGYQWFAKILPGGEQMWAMSYDSTVKSAGINRIPKKYFVKKELPKESNTLFFEMDIITKDTKITVQQAYKAMFMILNDYYKEGHPSYGLRDFLSEMVLVETENNSDDLTSADGARWGDWKTFIQQIIDENNDDNSDRSKPYYFGLMNNKQE